MNCKYKRKKREKHTENIFKNIIRFSKSKERDTYEGTRLRQNANMDIITKETLHII